MKDRHASASGLPADEDACKEADPRWGLGDVGAGLLGAFLLANLAVGLWLALVGGSVQGLGAMAAGQVGLWTGLVGSPLRASRRKGSASLSVDFGLRVRVRDAWGLPLGVASQLLAVTALYFVLERLVGELDVSGPARDLVARAGEGAGLVVVALLVAVAAPVIEEVFYRGLFLRSLARRVGEGWAVCGSSVVFGLSHFQLVQFPGLFFIGVVLAVLAVRTGRLGPSILAHVGFNGIVIVTLALGG